MIQEDPNLSPNKNINDVVLQHSADKTNKPQDKSYISKDIIKIPEKKRKSKYSRSSSKNKMVKEDASASPRNQNNNNSADEQQKLSPQSSNNNQNLTDTSESLQQNLVIQEVSNLSPNKNIDHGLLKHPADENFKSQKKSENSKGDKKITKRNRKPTKSQSQNKNKKKNAGKAGLQSRLMKKSRRLHKKR